MMDNKASFITLLVIGALLLSSTGFGADARRVGRSYRLNEKIGGKIMKYDRSTYCAVNVHGPS